MNKKYEVNAGSEYYFKDSKLIFIEKSIKGYGTPPTRIGKKEEILYEIRD